MRAVLALVALTIPIGGCAGSRTEEDSIRDAVQQYARGARDHDARALCSKMLPSTDLPRALARKLRVPEGDPGTPSAWNRDYRACARSFGNHGEFKSAAAGSVEVKRIDLGPNTTGADGISRTARVTAVFPGAKKPARLPMVKYRGDWKIVIEVN
jgi:uncharacterized protein YceK